MWVKLAKFASAGAVGTAAHYVVLVATVNWLGVPAAYAAMLGAAFGATINYGLSHSYVFRSKQRHTIAAPRFFLMALAGMGFNGLLVGLLVQSGWHYLIAQVVTTGIVLCINFGVSSVWIFKPPKRLPDPPEKPKSS